jgi:hypothetical protein
MMLLYYHFLQLFTPYSWVMMVEITISFGNNIVLAVVLQGYKRGKAISYSKKFIVVAQSGLEYH